MTAEALWARSGLEGTYEAWAFSDAPDLLAALVLAGKKTATCSAFDLYAREGEALPEPGEHSVILDGRGDAVCIIRTTRVYVVPYCRVSPEHAFMEGEGDRSLAYWRKAHAPFLTRELEQAGLVFDENTPVVCEEFERVYPS